MENRKWEQRSSEVDLNETHRELESKQLQLQQANLWAENAQRERINLCGELEMRNRLFQKSRAEECCCEASDRARQAR